MDCPRCQLPLETRRVEKERVEHCGACGGMFLALGALRAILSRAADGQPTRAAYSRPSPSAAEIRYGRCPACGETMGRQNFKDRSGVIVDLCPVDGVWLDGGKLETLVQFAASGAMARAEHDNAQRDANRRNVDRFARDLRGVGPRHYAYIDSGGSVGPSAEELAELTTVIPGVGPRRD